MKMNDLIIYQIFPLRAFVDETTEHGILEAVEWIPHIKKSEQTRSTFHRCLSLLNMDMIRRTTE